ncbi:hypothetical protein DFJ73DRAFT_837865 [Zopfochytrium polystomum]|nr:hypothetical protein DFJ73DRAFT_837865 [Zopfochytrium polystomum]
MTWASYLVGVVVLAAAVAASSSATLVALGIVPLIPPAWLVGSLPPPLPSSDQDSDSASSNPPDAAAVAGDGDDRPSPSRRRLRPNRLYFGSTHHTRFVPRHHAFVYPVVYAGISLDSLPPSSDSATGGGAVDPSIPSWLFGHNRRALFALWDQDYLADPTRTPSSIRARLLSALLGFGISAEEVGEVELVTSPRFLGVAFNPLNTYYVFGPKDRSASLRAVLLEVNNTFGERHLYLCDMREQLPAARAGFHAAFKLKRSFHVSPFNNRTGFYEAQIANPGLVNRMDVLLVIKEYVSQREAPREGAADATEPLSAPAKHLMARVAGTAVPLNVLSLCHVLLVYPVTLLMTTTRIMIEAWKLAYVKKLPVYQRPSAVRVDSDHGRTIIRKPPDSFQRYCYQVFLEYFENRLSQLESPLTLTVRFPDGTVATRSSPSSDPSPTPPPSIALHLASTQLPLRFVTDGENLPRALAVGFARGDWSTSPADMAPFLRLALAAPSPSPPTAPQQVPAPVRLARRVYARAAPSLSFLTAAAASTSSTFPTVSGMTASAASTPAAPLWVASGILAVWAEESWFALITPFVVDPYAVARRLQRYWDEDGGIGVGRSGGQAGRTPPASTSITTAHGRMTKRASGDAEADDEETKSTGSAESDWVRLSEGEAPQGRNRGEASQAAVDDGSAAASHDLLLGEFPDDVDIEVRERRRFALFVGELREALL